VGLAVAEKIGSPVKSVYSLDSPFIEQAMNPTAFKQAFYFPVSWRRVMAGATNGRVTFVSSCGRLNLGVRFYGF
jgi:hypothetical protein